MEKKKFIFFIFLQLQRPGGAALSRPQCPPLQIVPRVVCDTAPAPTLCSSLHTSLVPSQPMSAWRSLHTWQIHTILPHVSSKTKNKKCFRCGWTSGSLSLDTHYINHISRNIYSMNAISISSPPDTKNRPELSIRPYKTPKSIIVHTQLQMQWTTRHRRDKLTVSVKTAINTTNYLL